MVNSFSSSILSAYYGQSSSSGGFDPSLLTAYYNAKMGISSAAASDGTTGSTTGTGTDSTASPTGSADAPTSPWAYNTTMPQESDLVSSVMQGHNFIDPNAVTSDVLGSSADYTKLFTLYQGLNALEGIATAAQAKNVSPNQLAAYQRRFLEGMSEVQGYVSDTKYDHVSLTEGALTNELKNTVGTARTNSTYIAQNIQTGSAATAVKAFQGDVKFTMTVKRTGTATPYTINFDLSEMGDQTRSMSNVVSYMNAKLKAAGLDTKFAVNMTPAVPQTETVNGKTVTLSQGTPSFGLELKGVSFESVAFSAADTADAVFVAQSTGDPTKTPTTSSSSTSDTSTTTSTTSSTSSTTATATTDVTSQLLKFQADTGATGAALSDTLSKVGDTYYVAGEAEQTNLPTSVANVVTGTKQSENTVASNALATAAGSDGSVYVLANVDDTTDSQAIKGTQDVALMKYDSAGNLVYTRMLGASETASGYALAVSDTGQVAIAGSVTGALDINNPSTTTNKYGLPVATGVAASTAPLSGLDPTQSDSFVTVLDASGNEEWTQRRGAQGADQATSVAFGADGSVYVGGKTMTTMPGATTGEQGGWDGYVMGFSAQGQPQFTQQLGTAQTDSTAKVAVDGNTLYVASLQNNQATLSSYTLGSQQVTTTDTKGVSTTTTKTVATLDATRSLGGLGGGNISGMSVYDGKVYLGGSSGSNTLLAGATVTKAASGGFDAFALSVDSDLTDTSQDEIAYYGGAGTEKNAQVQFANGKAWISGQTTGAIDGTTQIGKQDGYLARLNIDTGQVEYQTRYTGTDGVVNTSSLAVSAGSSSVLDKLGLPQGSVLYTDSNLITANSAVRAGDEFYLVDPDTGVKKTITVDASDTMKTLATKIVRASGYKLTVDVTKVLGKQLDQLDIKPSGTSSQMEFLAGPAGKDALAGLGLPSGLVSNQAGQTMDASSSNYTTSQKPMGLSFDPSLNLNSTANINDAVTALQATIKKVQAVYTYLKYGDPQSSSSTSKGNTSGTAPAYLTAQIANYQAGLSRLLGTG